MNLRPMILTAQAALMLFCQSAFGQDRPQVEAYWGAPFGVARVSVRGAISREGSLTAQPVTEAAIDVRSDDALVLYPATDTPPVRALLRGALGGPQQTEVLFLFVSDRPFDVSVSGSAQASVRVTPRESRDRHRQLLQSWWRAYTSDSRRQARDADYPAVVQNYLTSMLAARLNLEPLREPRGLFASRGGDAEEMLGLLTGAESVRAAMQKETMLSGVEALEDATEPLPRGVAPPPVQVPPIPADVAVEPIAMHVPVECFYLRFGSFTNYRWFRATLSEWGGDLRNLISVRGLDYGMNARLERELLLRERGLAALLGPQVIADVAVIGNDTFLREGASIGMLFQARNNLALGSDIRQQRAEALKGNPSIKERTLKIAGHDVSFLSTPDNNVRSFYAVDGDFHLVTTSRKLVERFFAAGDGKGALGAADEFRHARAVMPLERDDTVFVYLSDAFFREIVSPAYRVEMTRRLQAVTDIELVKLARLAAQAEGVRSESIDDLIDAELLPPHFGDGPDGSGPVLVGDKVVDSLRGAQGNFTPIPDIDFDSVTPSEAQAYARFAEFYRSQWQQMDPVIVGIKREATDIKDLERIAVELHATPFAQRHYGFLAQFLGPPTVNRLAPMPEDLIALEVVAGGGFGLMFGRDAGIHHLFGGIRDSVPPPGDVEFDAFSLGRDWLRGYIGAWPRIGLLEFITGRGEWQFDPDGYALGVMNLWQRRIGDLSVVSFQRDLLQQVTPQLQVVEAERPAQVRLHVGDLSSSQLATVVNQKVYERAVETSDGNADLLQMLVTQLKVPEDQALKNAEDLLDAKLVCPLGGEYVLLASNDQDETPRWASTAWVDGKFDRRAVPDDYSAAPLDWFRGLELDFGLVEDTLSAHADLLVKRKPSGGFELPTFPTIPSKPVEKDPDAPEELPPPEPQPD